MSAQADVVTDADLGIGPQADDLKEPPLGTGEPNATKDTGSKDDLASMTEEEIGVLPPEAQARVRNLMADYTRKTQTLAEQRREFEGKAAYLDLAEQVKDVFDQEGPEAAAAFLNETATELRGGRRESATDRGGQPPTADPLQQMAQTAYEMSISPEAAPNEQELARGFLTLLQINAGVARELQETKSAASSGLRVAAEREIDQTLTSLFAADYKGMENDFDAFSRRVLSTAQREGVTNIATAAKLAYHDALIQRAQGQARQRTADKGTLPDAEGGGGSIPPTVTAPATVEEAARRAVQRVRAKYRH